jgi:hypothetical protein
MAARNALGVAGLIVGMLALALFAAAIGGYELFEWHHRSEVLAAQNAGRKLHAGAVAPMIELGLLLAGSVAAAITSLVGLGLSIAGLSRRPRALALVGLASSLLGPALAFCWLNFVAR